MSSDVREQIAEVIYNRDSFAGDDPWTRVHPVERERCRRGADAVLALPAVRDALAAQKALRRVRRVSEEWGAEDGVRHLPAWWILGDLRRALAGETPA